MKNMKKVLSLVLVGAMVASLAACSKKEPASKTTPTPIPTQGEAGNTNPEKGPTPIPTASVVKFEGDYIYKDSVSTLATNWNPHTYQTSDDSYPLDFITGSLYSLIFNDELHPIAGKEPFTGYVIVPEMAAGEPVDVTLKVKAEKPVMHIPESATEGYAWAVKLRDDLYFDDGTKITADTFIESYKRLLDPKLLNYRASDAYEGNYAIANAKNYALAGNGAFKSFKALETTYEEFIKTHSADEVVIDINNFWGISTATGGTWASITDETLIRDPAVAEGKDEDYVSGKYLWDTYLAPGKVYASYAAQYAGTIVYEFEAGYPFENVGLFKSGDNELTFVFNNAFSGFYLKTYALSTSWLIEPTLYDKCLKETTTASGSVWTSTYGTSVDTTRSYGPYSLTDYQLDKSMHYVQNKSWYGWTDGNHIYVDPEDGQTYPMYQTTEVDTQVVQEAATRKQMFLAGELMGYGLQSDDFDQYRNSEYTHATPQPTIYFAILNGYESVIKDREAAADFDKSKVDLETMTLNSFRRAFAVSFDRDDFCATVSPARVAGYGIVGNTYIYDPETCAYYRDTEQAMTALCDFYSVDTTKYATLKDAVNSITGFDPVKATELYQQAYKEALEKGFITDNDKDGKSDQTVTMTYSISSDSDFMTKMIDYLNEHVAQLTKGTGFEGKISIVKSTPCGNDWSNNIRNGIYDIVLAGWTGSTMDPFGLTDLYVNSGRQYDGKWFDATAVDVTLPINGKDITLNLKQWSDALNGETVTSNGVDYNFGYGKADVETRLNILAKIETVVLGTYDYIPIMNNGSMALLSQQVYYVVEEYNPVLSRGGMTYMKYNYNEAEWKDYVKSQNGQLKY